MEETTTTTTAPGSKTDMTNVLRGKKINPRTGTQTSEDDPDGVYADNVQSNIQIEHATHAQEQSTYASGDISVNSNQQ